MSTMSEPHQFDDYNAQSIDIYEGLLGIYRRPGMYIGNTGKSGKHHLIWEVVNNSADEAIAGFCDEINVEINEDNSITVIDNGRGIPVDNKKMADGSVKPAVEAVMTKVHAGGKFDSGAYRYSGGLHGVGISAVNALSSFVNVEIRRNGEIYEIGFEYAEDVISENGKEKTVPDPGHLVTPLHKTGKTTKSDTGTSITFLPNNDVFDASKWDIDLIKTRLKFLANIVPGTSITFTDLRSVDEETDEAETIVYNFENGLNDLVDERAEELGGYEEDGEVFFDILLADGNLSVESPVMDKAKDDGTQDQIGEIEIIAQWTNDRNSAVDSIVNGIVTPHGGTHVDGARKALVRTVNRVGKEIGSLDKDEKITWEDISHGIILVVNAYLSEPEFEGQTKSTLGGKEALRNSFTTAANRALSIWSKEHPIEMRDIVERAVEEMHVRVRRAEEDENRDKDTVRGNEPSKVVSAKLNDCHVHGPESELIVVEGDSAGGYVNNTRSETYQAVLPLRGKIKNPIANPLKADDDGNIILPAGPLSDMVNSLGCGTGTKFDASKLRYGRFVIMTDADDDGRHITMLILAIIHFLMPQLIEMGFVYEVRTPLFNGTYKDNVVFVNSNEEMQQIIDGNPSKKYIWERFKGLGQMDEKELFHYGTNPETRVLRQISLDDARIAAFDTAIDAVAGSNPSIKWDILSSMSENDGAFPEWLIADDLLDDAIEREEELDDDDVLV